MRCRCVSLFTVSASTSFFFRDILYCLSRSDGSQNDKSRPPVIRLWRMWWTINKFVLIDGKRVVVSSCGDWLVSSLRGSLVWEHKSAHERNEPFCSGWSLPDNLCDCDPIIGRNSVIRALKTFLFSISTFSALWVLCGCALPTNWQLKPGFHYPSSRPEFTGRIDGPWTRVHFLTPVNSARELG